MAQQQELATEQVSHPFPPVCAPDSRVLILGTMPSRQSRRQGFYYGHPQNRFWAVLAGLLQAPVPLGIEERRRFLLEHKIALWDVLQQCEISGSQDSSIREPVVNDLAGLLRQCPIRQIFTNGQTATRLYQIWCEPLTGKPCLGLPSTSPANGHFSLESLYRSWQPVRDALAADRDPTI